MSNFDPIWKEILDEFFYEIVEMFVPELFVEIDWTRPPESLQQELARISPEGNSDCVYVDKLTRVFLKSGAEEWLLIHVEVQSQRQAEFPRRMFNYGARLFADYDRWPYSLAILADQSKNWKPNSFESCQFDCQVRFQFRSIKLLDYDSLHTRWETPEHPLIWLIQAHFLAMRTSEDEIRATQKVALIKKLYNYGWDGAKVRRLFHFIDGLLRLPRDLDNQAFREIQDFERTINMPYVNIAERIGMEKGLKQGIEKGQREMLLQLLSDRFSDSNEDWEKLIERIPNQQISATAKKLWRTESVEEARQILTTDL